MSLIRQLSTPTLLTAFVILTSVAIVAQAGWAIVQDRALTLASERDNGAVTVRLLEEHASEQVAVAADHLATVATAIARLGSEQPPSVAVMHQAIDDSLMHSGATGNLLFVDRNGQRWISPRFFPYFVFPGEERAYIDELLQHPDNRNIVFGRAMRRFVDGELVLPFGRNVYDHQGRYLGVISTEISLTFLKNVYERVATAQHATVQLLSNSGALILRSPYDAHDANRDQVDPRLLATVNGPAIEGVFDEAAISDGVGLRLTSYRKIAHSPLVVSVGRNLDTVLANWRSRTRERIAFSGTWLVLQLLLSFVLLQHMRRLRASDLRARQSERNFIELFHYAPIALAQIDTDSQQLLEANSAMQAVLGYQLAALQGQTLNDLGVWVDPDAARSFDAMLAREPVLDGFEVTWRRHDGALRDCLLSSRVVDGSGVRMSIIAVADVTHQRQIEHDLKVKEDQSRLALQESANKSKFLADAAHDLRQPMHALGLLLEALHHANARRDAAKSAELAALSRDACNFMHASFNDVLDLSRLESGFVHAQLSIFDLLDLVEEVVASLAYTINDHQVALRVSQAAGQRCIVRSDRHLLGRVLTNILSNAIKYGDDRKPRGQRILVRLHGTPQHCRLAVIDNGIGMSPLHLENIFSPLFQINNPQRDRSKGLGLGLSIVAAIMRILDQHHIQINSVQGRGTRVTLGLPGAPREALAPAPPLLPGILDGARLAGLYVIYVEDDVLVRQSTAALLQEYGMRFEAVGSYEELQMLLPGLERIPDLVLTDYRLPHGHKGDDVARAVNAAFGQQIPLIVVSGELSDLEDAERMQGACVLKKPVLASALLLQISLAVEVAAAG